MGDGLGIEVVLEEQNLVLEHPQHWPDLAFRPTHRRQQLAVHLLGLLQLHAAGVAEAAVGVLLQFVFPFGEQCLGHFLNRVDAVGNRQCLGFAVIEFNLELAVNILQGSAVEFGECAEFFQGSLELHLGLLQSVAGIFDS